MLARLRAFATHFLGFVILPAQLPGDPVELMQDLMSEPWTTLKELHWSTFWALVRQICTYQKLTIPDDPQLERLATTRNKYLSQGWAHCPLSTVDGLTLDAFWKQPANKEIAPRFLIFVGGNAQKYEDWLPYFQLYADESGFGFLCFNFRGVARSEGTLSCPEDMLHDVGAAFDFLVEQAGVQPQHILLHGFSLGGAVAALFLARPGAPRAAITSDRSFRSYAHAGFGLMRGFQAAVGDAPRGAAGVGREAEEEHDARSLAVGAKVRAGLRALLVRTIALCRALIATLAYEALVAAGWELNALDAWRRIEGRKVIVYNTADNIVAYGAASLHAALLAEDAERGAADDDDSRDGGGSARKGNGGGGGGGGGGQTPSLANTAVVEVTIRHARGWALHDFPLSLDLDAWYGMIAAERRALGLSDDGSREL